MKNKRVKNKVLMIPAYYFPPYGVVSVMRIVKLCKWLPSHGWKPWVLTVDPRYYDQRNLVKLDDRDWFQTRIFRIPYLHFPGNRTLIKLLFPVIAFFFVLRWRKDVSATYLCGSPFHPFPLTFFFRKIIGLPSFLDFRDSWSINHGYDGKPRHGARAFIREHVFREIERFSIRHANRVFFATNVLEDEYKKLFPRFQSKFLTVPNGYDPDNIKSIVPKRVSEKKTLIIAGQFLIYTPEAIDPLMKMLVRFPDRHLVYVGKESEAIRKKSIEHMVEPQVDVFPLSSYQETLNLISGADLAVLSTGMVNGLGTKIFDYLALRKPILCHVPKGSVITRQFKNLPFILISNPPHMLENFCSLIEIGLAQQLNVEHWEHEIEVFTRPAAAATIAGILDEAIAT